MRSACESEESCVKTDLSRSRQQSFYRRVSFSHLSDSSSRCWRLVFSIAQRCWLFSQHFFDVDRLQVFAQENEKLCSPNIYLRAFEDVRANLIKLQFRRKVASFNEKNIRRIWRIFLGWMESRLIKLLVLDERKFIELFGLISSWNMNAWREMFAVAGYLWSLRV